MSDLAARDLAEDLDRPDRTASKGTEPIELAIGGMSCAACAARIEKRINQLDGARAVVNFATERAVVHGLPSNATQTVIDTVERAGYRAVSVGAADDATAQRADKLRMLRHRILVAALLTLPLSNLTIALALVPSLRFPGWEWLCVLIATPVVTWAAWPFHQATLRNLRHRSFSMDTLVSLGVGTAYLWAVVTLLIGRTDRPGYWVGWGPTPTGADTLYLEVAAAVTTFLLIGRYFEARARGAAGDVLGALRALAPATARVRRLDGREVEVPLGALIPGDTMIIRAGETVPADGTVSAGRSSVDTSSMTGEPVAKDVGPGDVLLAGTTNLTGVLAAGVDRVGSETQLEQMALLAEQAQARKARVQRLVDRVVSVFVPAVLIIATVTLVGWLITGAPLETAFSAALSVLIIACPCALGLATPTALMVGVGRAGQLGIVVKGPDAFEASGRIGTVVLDKTGTLTTGELAITDVACIDRGPDRARLLELAAALEAQSSHPIGRALAQSPPLEQGPAQLVVDEVTEISGLGISGTVDQLRIRVGSPRWFDELGLRLPGDLEQTCVAARDAGNACVLLAIDDTIVGAFVLADTIADSAADGIAALKQLGLSTVLLTGDATGPARRVGDALGVDAVIAEVLPTQKAAAIEHLQAQGQQVAMVGDGINDAAALATADLGLAVVHGTDLALKSADVIVVRRHLGVIADAIELSRRTLRTIRGNLIWAFGYNVAAIPLAASGWLNPLIAGFAMSFSSLFVVGNSLRLRQFTPQGKKTGVPT